MKILLLLAWLASPILFSAEDIRPICDSVGFCWSPQQLNGLMDYLKNNEYRPSEPNDWVAGISPHDDHLYAGKVYYPLFSAIRTKEVVMFGVTHATVRKEIGDPQNVLIFDEYLLWPGPYRPVQVSELRDILKKELESGCQITSNRGHQLEHSLEALIPFLQYHNREIKITPIMVTAMPFARMSELSEKTAALIAGYIRTCKLSLGKDIFFLISADANHYGRDFNNTPYGEDENAHRQGISKDLRIANECLTGIIDTPKIESLTKELWGATYRDYKNSYWCGKYSIPFGLLTIEKIVGQLTGQKLRGRLLAYSDTYSGGVIPLTGNGFGITAPFSLKHWVGFLSAAYSVQKR